MEQNNNGSGDNIGRDKIVNYSIKIKPIWIGVASIFTLIMLYIFFSQESGNKNFQDINLSDSSSLIIDQSTKVDQSTVIIDSSKNTEIINNFNTINLDTLTDFLDELKSYPKLNSYAGILNKLANVSSKKQIRYYLGAPIPTGDPYFDIYEFNDLRIEIGYCQKNERILSMMYEGYENEKGSHRFECHGNIKRMKIISASKSNEIFCFRAPCFSLSKINFKNFIQLIQNTNAGFENDSNPFSNTQLKILFTLGGNTANKMYFQLTTFYSIYDNDEDGEFMGANKYKISVESYFSSPLEFNREIDLLLKNGAAVIEQQKYDNKIDEIVLNLDSLNVKTYNIFNEIKYNYIIEHYSQIDDHI